MKKSQFNLFFRDAETNRYVVFNAKSTAMAVISEDELNLYKKLVLKDFVCDNQIEKTFLNELEKGDFIFKDNENEIEVLKYLQKSIQFSQSSLNLTIAPTMACNFKCVYCYQGEHNSIEKMDKSIQESIIDFIKSKIHKIDSLNITWYGGEPLLAIDIIESLTKKFLDLCKQHKVSYNAGIITNGYYLNKFNAKKLLDLKIEMVQITLDGPKDYHDLKRPLKNGHGTFDVIISNLIEIKEIFNKKISLRINTDQYNYEYVEEVINILEDNNLLGYVIPYLGYVDSTNDFYDHKKCLSPEKFLNVKNQFLHKLYKENYEQTCIDYPKVRLNSCLADSINGYVIDPKGNLTKCWCDIGHDEYCVGNISDGTIQFNRLIEYFNYDIFSDDKCKECNIIPICLGGCPRRRIDNTYSICNTKKLEVHKAIIKEAKARDNTLKELYFCDI